MTSLLAFLLYTFDVFYFMTIITERNCTITKKINACFLAHLCEHFVSRVDYYNSKILYSFITLHLTDVINRKQMLDYAQINVINCEKSVQYLLFFVSSVIIFCFIIFRNKLTINLKSN